MTSSKYGHKFVAKIQLLIDTVYLYILTRLYTTYGRASELLLAFSWELSGADHEAREFHVQIAIVVRSASC